MAFAELLLRQRATLTTRETAAARLFPGFGNFRILNVEIGSVWAGAPGTGVLVRLGEARTEGGAAAPDAAPFGTGPVTTPSRPGSLRPFEGQAFESGWEISVRKDERSRSMLADIVLRFDVDGVFDPVRYAEEAKKDDGRLLLMRGAIMDPTGVSNVAKGSGTVSVTFDVPSLASGIAGSVRNIVVLIIGLSADVRLSVETATLGTPSLIAEGGIALSAGGPLAGEPVRTSALDTLIGTAANQKFVVKIDKAGSGSMVDFTKVRDVVLGLDYGP